MLCVWLECRGNTSDICFQECGCNCSLCEHDRYVCNLCFITGRLINLLWYSVDYNCQTVCICVGCNFVTDKISLLKFRFISKCYVLLDMVSSAFMLFEIQQVWMYHGLGTVDSTASWQLADAAAYAAQGKCSRCQQMLRVHVSERVLSYQSTFS